MISDKLIAIDLGSTHISVMSAEINEDGLLRVISSESKPSDDVKWGIVEKPSGASYKLNELLKLLRNSSHLTDISKASVAVGAKSMKLEPETVSRNVPKPHVITEELLSDMLAECERRAEDPEQIIFDVIPVAYFVDGKRMDEPVGRKASQITAKYHVVAGNKQIKNELDRCFDRTGITVEYIPLGVETLSSVLLSEEEKNVGCALINLGGTTTTLAVYHDGALQHLLVVPLGAVNITRDIQELGISQEHAEKLKRLKGNAMERMVDNPVYVQIPSVDNPANPVKISTMFIATIIQARLEEILQPVFEMLANLKFGLDAGIVITGGGAKLNGIIEFITDNTGIYTRFGDHSDWLTQDSPAQYSDPQYAQLIGTLQMTAERRKEHPEEVPVKPPKLPRRNPLDKLADGFLRFFDDDAKMS